MIFKLRNATQRNATQRNATQREAICADAMSITPEIAGASSRAVSGVAARVGSVCRTEPEQPGPDHATEVRLGKPDLHAKPFRIFSCILGVLLLAAAALKLYGLSVSPVARIGVFADPWFQRVVVQFELLLGLWLLSGKWQPLAWIAVLGTFLTFSGFSLYSKIIGQSSCGCFGSIQVNPIWTLAFDVLVVVLLLRMPPGFRGWGLMSRPEWRGLAKVAGGMAICFIAMYGIAVASFGSFSAALAHLHGERITIAPALVDMGTAQQGEVRTVQVELRNWTDQPICIVGGKDDCSCTTTRDLPVTIPPKESRPIGISVQFVGTPGVFTRTTILYAEDEALRTVPLRLTGRTVAAFETTGSERAGGNE